MRPAPRFVLAACALAVALAAAANADAQPVATVTTDDGAFTIALRPDLAPRHVAHFLKVARARGYDGTVFHRIVPRGIIQGGDPLSKDPKKKSLYGTGGLGLLKAEFSAEPMKRGAVAAVLRPSSPNSAGNQFFICLSDQAALNGKFTIFGEVTSGMDVVDAIGARPVTGDKATERIVIRSVTIADGVSLASPSPAAR